MMINLRCRETFSLNLFIGKKKKTTVGIREMNKFNYISSFPELYHQAS